MIFINRQEAARKLAQKLTSYKKRQGVLVLGIPRGGIVTAKTIADYLKVPLEVLVTRKIGAPNQSELAIGAVGPNGTVILDDKLIAELGIEKDWLEKEIRAKRLEISRRMKQFRVGRVDLKSKTVILVDDGIATGATVEAGLKYLKQAGTKKIILAVPVASSDAARRLGRLAERSIILETPENFYAVGQFYEDFPQVTDEEVIQLLQ